jgi:hypothetical protein
MRVRFVGHTSSTNTSGSQVCWTCGFGVWSYVGDRDLWQLHQRFRVEIEHHGMTLWRHGPSVERGVLEGFHVSLYSHSVRDTRTLDIIVWFIARKCIRYLGPPNTRYYRVFRPPKESMVEGHPTVCTGCWSEHVLSTGTPNERYYHGKCTPNFSIGEGPPTARRCGTYLYVTISPNIYREQGSKGFGFHVY